MDEQKLFEALLLAENESAVTSILDSFALLPPENWRPLGGMENNFGIVGNQQDDPTAAMVEKIINSIDAVLMRAAFKAGVNPEGSDAPQSMAAAVDRFFGIREGNLENVTAAERTRLAENIQFVAVGSRDAPSYLVIDTGEGQTPSAFEDTFLSLARSNKMKIPFVQGRFNAGGTGVLQFCGKENYQLIASKRAPEAPQTGDTSANRWGFTIVRRILPSEGRRNSVYAYLAPGGTIPSFEAQSIPALPEVRSSGRPAVPYKKDLESGTVIKLYNYSWKPRSIATTDARFDFERLLQAPCLPFRIIETREYRANYFATTLSGVWTRVRGAEPSVESEDESSTIESGFPSYAEVDIPNIGSLPYGIAVFKEEVSSRRIPNGVFFVLNGQVHGSLVRDFVSRRLRFDYLASHLLISVDCTNIDARVREDFFLASRDRVRRSEVYDSIESTLAEVLRDHPGLRELNSRRRARKIQEALANDKEAAAAFQDLIKSDPALAALFGTGSQLVTSIGPATEPKPYDGKRFPSFFRIAKEPSQGLVKVCPENWKCKVDFETDAMNDYFQRADSPGRIDVIPAEAIESKTLWNGQFITYFRPPPGASVGDVIRIRVVVADDERDMAGAPFDNSFQLRVTGQRPHEAGGSDVKRPRNTGATGATAPRLALPNVFEVRRDKWVAYQMSEIDAIRIRAAEEGEGYDLYLNMDNIYLLNEIRRDRASNALILEFWFKYGIALVAASLLKLPDMPAREPTSVSKEDIENLLAGVGRVILPVIRRLHDGPGALAD